MGIRFSLLSIDTCIYWNVKFVRCTFSASSAEQRKQMQLDYVQRCMFGGYKIWTMCQWWWGFVWVGSTLIPIYISVFSKMGRHSETTSGVFNYFWMISNIKKLHHLSLSMCWRSKNLILFLYILFCFCCSIIHNYCVWLKTF